jgi:glycosyltransferase involved in cell wall biosynthesis
VKILFLHQFDLDLAGGSGTYLRRLTGALKAKGHDVEVVASRRPDRYGLTTYALPFDFTLTFGPECRDGERTFDELSDDELRVRAAEAADSMAPAVTAARRPDFLLVNHIALLADAARRVKEKHGVPYRIISYGTDVQLLLRDRRYRTWLDPVVAGADRIFAISEFVADQLRSLFPSAPTSVLGGAVERSVFSPGPPPEPANRIAFVGRLVTEKGLWPLLDATAGLGDHLVLDVAGEGPLSEELHKATADRRSPAVNLLGYLRPEEVADVLRRSAVAVVPSLWQEPLGLVVMEAMACGVPVVATRVGGIPEVVRHGENGLLVEPGDVDGLAGALRSVLGDGVLRERLRRGCLATPIPTYEDLAESVPA